VTADLDVAVVSHAPRGGSGVIARELGAGLAARGHRVTWLTTEDPGAVPDGVAAERVHLPHYPVLDHAPSTIAMATALAAFIDRAERPVIHVHYALPWAVSAWLARQMATRRAGVVVTLHGTDVTGVGSDPAYARALHHAVAAADAVTTPSQALLDTDFAARGMHGARTTVVPNFVDTERFRPAAAGERMAIRGALTGHADELPWVLHLSNLRPVKAPETLAAAAALVARERPCRIVLAGDGPERGAVVSILRGHGLGDRLIETGSVERPELWLRAADVLLLPSRQESFGLAALEAMSSGLPVVASDVGGLRELVEHGATGLLCPVGDVRAFAEATGRVISDPALTATLGAAARHRATTCFGREVAVDRYLDVYHQALENAP
jgi:N-acetyl-alpha-D-glucosaminyl L-malate synthase BshA